MNDLRIAVVGIDDAHDFRVHVVRRGEGEELVARKVASDESPDYRVAVVGPDDGYDKKIAFESY